MLGVEESGMGLGRRKALFQVRIAFFAMTSVHIGVCGTLAPLL
jgi:hypothetical protein